MPAMMIQVLTPPVVSLTRQLPAILPANADTVAERV